MSCVPWHVLPSHSVRISRSSTNALLSLHPWTHPLILLAVRISFHIQTLLSLHIHIPLRQRRRRSSLILRMLLRRLTLGRPRMDARDLVLERRINQAVALQRVEALELRRHDQRCEGLAAAACLWPFCQLQGGVVGVGGAYRTCRSLRRGWPLGAGRWPGGGRSR